MVAVVRLILLALFFIVSTVAGLLICLLRPFHPNNVYWFSLWYGSVSRILGIEVEIRRDPAIQAGVLVISSLVIVVNVLTEILHTLFNPLARKL